MNNKITIILLLLLSIISIYNVKSISINNLNTMKDVEFKMYHNDDDKDSCSIIFKPKLIPQSTNSITSIDSINFKKAIQIKCNNELTKEKRLAYQKSCDLFKTTVVSDKDSNNLSFSSLPKSNLQDSSLKYEFLKINLDSNLNIIASNYQLKKTSPTTGENSDNKIFVLIEFPEDVLKLVYDEPAKVEKEKEKEKEKEENKSFFAKYWLYLVPLFLIMAVNMMAPPPGQANAAQANTASAAAPRK